MWDFKAWIFLKYNMYFHSSFLLKDIVTTTQFQFRVILIDKKNNYSFSYRI